MRTEVTTPGLATHEVGTTSPCPNLTMTMMAIASQGCDYLAPEYKAGRS